jgi:hypothetical protein
MFGKLLPADRCRENPQCFRLFVRYLLSIENVDIPIQPQTAVENAMVSEFSFIKLEIA